MPRPTETLIADYSDVTVAVYAAPQSDGDRRAARAGRCGDRGGRRAGPVGPAASRSTWRRIIPTIDPILPELRSALADLAPCRPRIPLISTVGETRGTAPTFDADYWAANLRNPVRFSQAVAAASENHSAFVEISPHPLLTYAISDTVRSTSSADRFTVTSALKRGDDETLLLPCPARRNRRDRPPSRGRPTR